MKDYVARFPDCKAVQIRVTRDAVSIWIDEKFHKTLTRFEIQDTMPLSGPKGYSIWLDSHIMSWRIAYHSAKATKRYWARLASCLNQMIRKLEVPSCSNDEFISTLEQLQRHVEAMDICMIKPGSDDPVAREFPSKCLSEPLRIFREQIQECSASNRQLVGHLQTTVSMVCMVAKNLLAETRLDKNAEDLRHQLGHHSQQNGEFIERQEIKTRCDKERSERGRVLCFLDTPTFDSWLVMLIQQSDAERIDGGISRPSSADLGYTKNFGYQINEESNNVKIFPPDNFSTPIAVITFEYAVSEYDLHVFSHENVLLFWKTPSFTGVALSISEAVQHQRLAPGQPIAKDLWHFFWTPESIHQSQSNITWEAIALPDAFVVLVAEQKQLRLHIIELEQTASFSTHRVSHVFDTDFFWTARPHGPYLNTCCWKAGHLLIVLDSCFAKVMVFFKPIKTSKLQKVVDQTLFMGWFCVQEFAIFTKHNRLFLVVFSLDPPRNRLMYLQNDRFLQVSDTNNAKPGWARLASGKRKAFLSSHKGMEMIVSRLSKSDSSKPTTKLSFFKVMISF